MPPFRIAKPRVFAYFIAELFLVLGVVLALARVTLLIAPVPGAWQVPSIVVLSVLFCAVLFSTQWLNLGDDAGSNRSMFIFFVVSLLIGLLCSAAVWVVLDRDQRLYPAALALQGAFVVPAVLAAWRWVSLRLNLFRVLRERVLILGTGETARQVCRWVVAQSGSEYGVVGFADELPGREGEVLAMGARIQTDYESLATFCPPRVDRVIVALDEKRKKLPVRQLMEVRLRGIDIEEATSFFERTSGKIAVETMLPSWLIFSEGFKATQLRSILKRTSDLFFSTILFIVTLPLMLITAILIRLDSRGPVLYRQTRLGRDGREFDVLKFRSMREGAESDSGPTWAARHDPRITRLGRLIRPLRIDELPQLINVIRGEMSFVGPRPEREHFVSQLEDQIPYYGLRLIARPGVTGWAQVKYGYAATEEDALEKLKYDLYYIKNNNLLFDLWIVLKTFGVVLGGRGQ